MKEYRKIESTKFLYEITRNGNLRNVKSKKHLKFQLDKDGYYFIHLNAGKLNTIRRQHQLVMEAWGTTKPEWATSIDHIDQNKKNNDISNLRWANSFIQATNRSYSNNPGKQTIKYAIEVLKKKCIMYDKNDNIEKVFDSIKDAAIYIKENYSEYSGNIRTIVHTIGDSKKYCYKHKWKICNDYPEME